MPPAKKPTKSQHRKLTPKHKEALAEGRNMSAVVDAYLKALHTPKRRGRKVTHATLVTRLNRAETAAKNGRGLDRLVGAQTARDTRARINELATTNGTGNLKTLEAAFVKVVVRFSEKRGVGYGAWRDAGVPAEVLRRAGIARTRGR